MAKSNRVVSAKKGVITRLRGDKGWTSETLAHEAGLSIRTVEAAERGQPKFVETLERIAKALGTTVVTLRTGVPAQAMQQNIKIVINAELTLKPPEQGAKPLEQSVEVANLVQSIRQLINAFGPITPLSVRLGSIILTCEMQAQDALRLVAATKRGLTKAIHISKIHVLDMLVTDAFAGTPLGVFGDEVRLQAFRGDSPETIAEDYGVDSMLIEGMLAYDATTHGPLTLGSPSEDGILRNLKPGKDERRE